MKLGYYYTVTAEGAGSKEVIVNGNGNWTTVENDERRLWQKYAVNGICLAMTFTENGLVLVVAKVLGGSRPDNNVSTWIHIPSNIKITGHQIKQIVEEILKLYLNVGTMEVTEESFKSNAILGNDFEEKHYGLVIKPSLGVECAFRSDVSDYTIWEVLDSPFQDYYQNFKYVFLFKGQPTVTQGLTDLSSYEILDMKTVLPPSKDSIQRLFGSVNVTIDVDNQNFISPILRKKASTLMLTARRAGCLPVDFYAQVLNDEQEPEYLPVKQEWRKILGGISIDVRDEETDKPIHHKYDILDPEWDAKTQSLPEHKLHDVKIRVTADGFEQKETHVDFTRPIRPIYLGKTEEKKEYSCHTEDGRKLKILIIGEGARSTHPIDGYTASNDRLIYKGDKFIYGSTSSQNTMGKEYPRKPKFNIVWNSWIKYLLIALAAILLGATIWAYKSGNFSNLFANDQPTAPSSIGEEGQQIQANNDTVTKEQNLKHAKEYISSCNGKLHKGKLESNPETVGLYKALNEFKLEELVENWDVKFGEISGFIPIIKASEACIHKKNDPTQKGNRPTYNEENDTTIIITNWVNWVDSECANYSSSNSNGNSTQQQKPSSKEQNTEGENPRGNDW